ncbi:MAG: trypsin-like peptidase domain-containing protein [Thaumarchaeota archaeon]|nr:trypsin-like peptidase domain-containing protein [Nitrososphaerota archaeon]
MNTKERGAAAVPVILIIAVILVGAVALYANYQLTQSNSTSNSRETSLQRLVNELQAENAQLRNQPGSGPGSLGNTSGTLLGLDPIAIYKADNSSVVTIDGFQVTTVNTLFGSQQRVQEIIGSGFVVNYLNSFYIVTNFHVVNGVTNITATFWNGDAYPAKVVGSDPYSDLGIVSVEAPSSELTPLKLSLSSRLTVGQPVAAIGNPFGLSGSMTYGIVSQLGRTLQETTAGSFLIADVVQFSAPINPGNSGGPLLDSAGNVVGITTAVVAQSQGVGFAIPSDTIIRELASLISTGSYGLHPYLGIGTVDMNYQLSKIQGTSVTYGVLVETVASGGPAAKAGILSGVRNATIAGTQYSIGGDIIVSINGTKIINTDALSSYLEERAAAGQTAHVGIIRNGQNRAIDVVLGTRPPLNV